jgi:ribosomal protein L12E/L44/L45/RPP1/RPP2
VELDELLITSTVGASPAAPAPAAAPATSQASAVGSAAPAAAPGALPDPEQLREQVLRWVRAELLVNRERAGRLTDLR